MAPNVIKLHQLKSNINRSSTASGYVSESILPWDGLYAVEEVVVRAVNTNIIRQLKGIPSEAFALFGCRHETQLR